jgi:hypothetical protein
LELDIFLKIRAFKHHRDLIRQRHQHLKILVIERLTSDPMAEEEPAADLTGRVQRHEYLSPDRVKGATKQFPLLIVARSLQVAAVDEVGIQFEPPYKRVPESIFELLGFWQTAQACAQTEFIARLKPTEDSDSGYHRGVGQALHKIAQQGVSRLTMAKEAWEPEHRQHVFHRFWR